MSLFTSLAPVFNRAVRCDESTDNASGVDQAAVQTVRPQHEIRETDDAFGLTVYLPGVSRENLEITAENDELRVFGRRAVKQPEGWQSRHRETADAAFELSFSHDHSVNLDGISAELSDGVLRLSLPKSEAVKPRKITVS